MDSPTDFIGQVHTLITEYRQMRAEHLASLEVYCDANGEPRLKDSNRYDETRATNAIEASDWLDDAMRKLLALAGEPVPGKPYTVAFHGNERHYSDEAPTFFVVNGSDLDDVRRTLTALPSFRKYYEAEHEFRYNNSPVLEFVPHLSVSGLPDCHYKDLRREQAALLAAGPLPEVSILVADLRDALIDWFVEGARPLPKAVTIRAEREGRRWAHRLEPDYATLHYPNGDTERTASDSGFKTAIADALAQLNAEHSANPRGLTVLLLPEQAPDAPISA